MIVSRARVKPNEDVLIWGIGGGVALAALQICKLIGARTWVVSGSDDKLRRAAELGADVLLNRTTADVARTIRERTNKRGVDVVVDNVGKATWEQSLRALGRRGRLVSCGATSGPIVDTDLRRLFWNQWSILGSTMGNDAEFDAIVAELGAGRLMPVVDSVFSLADGRAAFERLARRRAIRKGRHPRPVSDATARFEPEEERAIREAYSRGAPCTCPRDGATMTERSIGGGRSGWAMLESVSG
jgi:NADPH:quinone reductase-like Zn-dependent oxidoreductase